MWAFPNFPAKLEYTPEGPDRPTYQVEVFGYLHTTGTQLVAFRKNVLWAQIEIGAIELLSLDEFERKFKKFKLVED